MRNQSNQEIHDEIEPMLEAYLRLKRRGRKPTIDQFIEQYPAEHRASLREKIDEYEQMHRLFGAYQRYEEKKAADEVSPERVNAALERFRQRVSPLPWWRRLWRGVIPAFQWPVWTPVLTTAVVGLIMFSGYQHSQIRTVEATNDALSSQVQQTIAQNARLERSLAGMQMTLEQSKVELENERRQQESLTATVEGLKLENASIQQINAALKNQVKQLHTTNERIQRRLTAQKFIAEAAFDLVAGGMVQPPEPLRVAMAEFHGETTRSALRSTRSRGSEKEKYRPIPFSPVLTVVRETAPTLKWEASPRAEKYQVIVTDASHNLLWDWESDAGTETQVRVPVGKLQDGEIYFWQVEAIVNGQPHLSPIVGFKVIDTNTLREVEAVEQSYPNSAVVLASLYAAHGLYEEALVQIDQLAEANPKGPLVPIIRDNLLRQLGRE